MGRKKSCKLKFLANLKGEMKQNGLLVEKTGFKRKAKQGSYCNYSIAELFLVTPREYKDKKNYVFLYVAQSVSEEWSKPELSKKQKGVSQTRKRYL